jgi:hypothetical protein
MRELLALWSIALLGVRSRHYPRVEAPTER